LSLITGKLNTMAGAPRRDSIRSKCKAVTALFPYAVWRGRDGQRGLLGTLFQLFGAMVWQGQDEVASLFSLRAMASDRRAFMWHCVEPLVAVLLNEESPISLKQAAILASPYLPWKDFTNNEHLLQLWAMAAPEVPYTNDIGQSVVDTLLWIANDASPRLHIPVGMWSWLNKRPSLPPVCLGRFYGFTQDAMRAVRTLKDVEILKSYLLLIWSEWDEPWWVGFSEMCALLREDFGGIGMGHHREDLLRRLDYVLGRLDLGPEHLHPKLTAHLIWCLRKRYEKLRDVLREVDGEAKISLIRELNPGLIVFFGPLTTADVYRVPFDFYVFTPYSVSIVAHLDRSSLILPTRGLVVISDRDFS